MNKAEIEKIRRCAKQDYIWKAWYIQKALAACVKRASKRQFQMVTGLQEMVRYDNDSNFILSDKAFDKKEQDSITDNLNKQIAAEIPQGPKDAIDVDVSDTDPNPATQGNPSVSDEEPAANPPTEGAALQLHMASGSPLAFDSFEKMVSWIKTSAKFNDIDQLQKFKEKNKPLFETIDAEIMHELDTFFSETEMNLEKGPNAKKA